MVSYAYNQPICRLCEKWLINSDNLGIDQILYQNEQKYLIGFSNPNGENRCWLNATLQTLRSIPVFNVLDSICFDKYNDFIENFIKIIKILKQQIISQKEIDELIR